MGPTLHKGHRSRALSTQRRHHQHSQSTGQDSTGHWRHHRATMEGRRAAAIAAVGQTAEKKQTNSQPGTAAGISHGGWTLIIESHQIRHRHRRRPAAVRAAGTCSLPDTAGALRVTAYRRPCRGRSDVAASAGTGQTGDTAASRPPPHSLDHGVADFAETSRGRQPRRAGGAAEVSPVLRQPSDVAA